MYMTRICEVCRTSFVRDITPKQLKHGRGKYCSRVCAVNGTGNLRKSDNRGSNHGAWKGDAVKYGGLHCWVNKHKPRPALCEECKKAPPLDLANKGVYDRNFNNWEYLCRKCHMTKDGRLKRAAATQFKKGNIPWNKKV